MRLFLKLQVSLFCVCINLSAGPQLSDEDMMQIAVCTGIWKERWKDRSFSLAIGGHAKEFSEVGLEGPWLDPPEGVLAELRKAGYQVQAFSARRGANAEAKKAAMFWVTKQKALSATEVQFECGIHEGALAAMAFEVVVEKREGKWAIKHAPKIKWQS